MAKQGPKESGLTAQQQKFLANPKVGEKLARGESVRLGDLPLDLQREITTTFQDPLFQSGATTPDVSSLISLPEAALRALQGQTSSPVTPFKSLKELTGTAPIAPQAAASTAPTTTATPIEQSTVVGGGLDTLLTRLQNLIAPQVLNNPVARLTGIPGLLDAISAQPTQIGTSPEQVGQGVSGTEGIQRFLSNLFKNVQQVVPSTTIEQAATQELEKQFPELASQAGTKGLKRFAGAGEFKIKGNRYKIDEAGRIIKAV